MASTGAASVKRANGSRGYGSCMGSWYWIGVSVGVGAAVGVLLSAMAPLGSRVISVSGSIVGVAVTAGLVAGSVPWYEGWPGFAGGVLAIIGTPPIVWGAVRRGGTRGGIAVIVAGAAVVVAGIAFIPAAGFLEALALPALAARLRRTQPERYAGLRTLAKD